MSQFISLKGTGGSLYFRYFLIFSFLTYVNGAFSQAPSVTYPSLQSYRVGKTIATISPINTGGPVPAAVYGEVTTLAGSGLGGNTNGAVLLGSFNHPTRTAININGDILVCDRDNGSIRKISSGLLSTVVTNLSQPNGVSVDLTGNIFVADAGSNTIKKISPGGTVAIFAGNGNQGFLNGTGSNSSFYYPFGLSLDLNGNAYVADTYNHAIRKITPQGLVSTVAGSGFSGFANGAAISALFNNPNYVVADGAGNLYVSDPQNNMIRKISTGGQVSTFAGSQTAGFIDGDLSSARFRTPSGLALDFAGNLYVADFGNNAIRKIDKAGVVSTVAGGLVAGNINGVGAAASFNKPNDVQFHSSGYLIITDHFNNMIRKVSVSGYVIDKPLPKGLVFDPLTGNITGTAMQTSPPTNYTITAYNATGSSSTVINVQVLAPEAPSITYQTPQRYFVDKAISSLFPNNVGGAVPATMYGEVTTVAGSGATGATDGAALSATFNRPIRTTIDGDNIFVSDRDNGLIRKISSNGIVSTFAVNLNQPNGLLADASGNIFVEAAGVSIVQKITSSGLKSDFAGNGTRGLVDGQGTAAQFYFPYGLSRDAAGNMFVADAGNNAVRKISPQGLVSTVAGNGTAGFVDNVGTAARLNNPNFVLPDGSGNLYVSEPGNNSIRKISGAGAVTTYWASQPGFSDGDKSVARFRTPTGMTFDLEGNLYLSDFGNHAIRKIDKFGKVSTIAGDGISGSVDGIGKHARFNNPNDIQIDPQGYLIVADVFNNKIRKVCTTGYTIDKPLPTGLSFDPSTGKISGTPSISSPATDYTVTAYNNGGSSSTILSIEVVLPVVNFPAIPAKVICDNDFDPAATSSLTPVTYSSNNPSVATVVNNKIHITGAGTAVIKADNGIETAQQVLTVLVPDIPQVVLKSSALSVCSGSPLTFTAEVTNGGLKPDFQWTVNGLIKGSNSETLVTTVASDSDVIECRVSNTDACLVSSTAKLSGITVNPLMTPSVTINSSAKGSVCPGTSISFTANPVNGGTNPSFEWKVNGIKAGDNSPNFSTTSLSNGDAISCVLTSSDGGCLTSSTAVSNFIHAEVVSLASLQPRVSIVASADNICQGSSVTFTARVANGGANPAYQWFSNGVATRSNSNTFTTAISSASDVVFCKVTNSDLCPVAGTSNSISGIIVKPAITPSVTITSSAAGSVCQGTPVVFTANALNGGANPIFEWRVNGTKTGGSTSIFSTNSLNTGDVVSCILTSNDGGCLTSSTAVSNNITANFITLVSPLPTVSITSSASSICRGGSVTFTATVSDGGLNPSYQWILNGLVTGGNSSIFTTPVSSTSDVVLCKVTNSDSCPVTGISNSISGIVVKALVTPSVTIRSSVSGAICPGSAISFTATPANGGANPGFEWKVNGVKTGINTPVFTTSVLANGDLVSCTLTNNDPVCTTSATASSNSIKVNITATSGLTPIVEIASTPKVINSGAEVTLTASVNINAALSWEWLVNGLSTGINASVFKSRNLRDKDVITCRVSLQDGCTILFASSTFVVEVVAASDIIIPNVITPNNDAINDVWNIKGLINYSNCKVSVFDRRGTLLFQSLGYPIPWNGSYKGSVLPAGAYYYIIDLGLENKKRLSGSVAIVR